MIKKKCPDCCAWDEIPEDYEGEENLVCWENGCEDELQSEFAYDYTLDENIPDHEKIAQILDECKELLASKGEDYNNGRVKMGDYYPRGVHSVIDIIHAKVLRMYSLLEKGEDANFESIEDSAKDLINFSGIFIGVSRGWIKTPADRNTQD